MRLLVRTAIKSLLFLAVTLAVLLAVVWPWPAPEVDWRTPVETALAKKDCATVVDVLNAAAGAGSADAYRLRATLAKKGPCFAGERVPDRDEYGMYVAREVRNRGHRAVIAFIYGLDENDLGPWSNLYVREVLFLCGAPYNQLQGVDYVELSTILGERPSFVLSVHQRRREICVRVLERLAAHLIAAATPASQEIAHAILGQRPSSHDARSTILFAELVLGRGFVTKAGTEFATIKETDRSLAWLTLMGVADRGNERAIRMMIAYLHEGRFRPRDDKEAFFWLIRLRRLGKSYEPIGAAIEGALTEAERTKIIECEKEGWSALICFPR